jgi:hypothetical protein
MHQAAWNHNVIERAKGVLAPLDVHAERTREHGHRFAHGMRVIEQMRQGRKVDYSGRQVARAIVVANQAIKVHART